VVALIISEGVKSPQHQKLVRGVCLDSIFERGWAKGWQCSPNSQRCASHTPPQWKITTRSGGPRCRMGLGVSLVSPRETTLCTCLPARPWPSSSHDRTSELLASPGWALTAASCILMSYCPSAVGFSEPLSAEIIHELSISFPINKIISLSVRLARTAMEQSGLTRWNVAELAVLYTLRACMDAKDYAVQPAGVI